MPALRRRAIGVVTFVTLAGIAVLILSVWPGAGSQAYTYSERLPARVQRVEPCRADSFEAALAEDGALTCHLVLVELLEGSDKGQLFSLSPLFSQPSGPREYQPFVVSELIEVRHINSQDSAAQPSTGEVSANEQPAVSPAAVQTSRYFYAERNRSASLVILLVIAVGAVLVTGQWFGVRIIAIGLATIGLLVFFAIPALGTSPVSGGTAEIVAIVSGLAILAVVLALDGPFRLPSQVVFLVSALATVGMVGIGRVGLHLTQIGDPVPAEVFARSPLGTGSNVDAFVLLGLTLGSIVLVASLARDHTEAVLSHRGLTSTPSPMAASTNTGSTNTASPTTASRVTDGRDSLGSAFFAGFNGNQHRVAGGVGLFVLASLSASLPLLGMFGNNNLTASQALNNEMLAATIVRISAGVLGLVLVGPIAAGLTAVLTGGLRASSVTPDRSGVILEPRPPMRREPQPLAGMVIHLEQTTPQTGPSGLDRFRVGVEDRT